ncbi:MAG: hypothetical protein IH877_04615 [Gemmatimonadetes bacterium]|nr:hypothetical protein [Gemmatimonadota bacterium]
MYVTDGDVVRRVLGGEVEAYAILVNRYGPIERMQQQCEAQEWHPQS